jgi:peroxiredoxin
MTLHVAAGTPAPDFTFDTPDAQGLDFHKAIDGTMTVLFFLRYVGCPICQVRLAELRRDMAKFWAQHAVVFVVLQSDPAIVRQAMEGEAMPFTVICDPEQAIFKLYGVEPGNILQYIAPSVIMKSFKASRAGFAHGLKEGNEMQRPAVFIINRQKTVAYAYHGRNIGDLPDNAIIAAKLKGVRKAGR